MSMILDTGEVNRFNPRPLTNLQGGRGFGIRYPSPFFDVAQQFLPENVHQLHLWCRYYFLTNPVVNAAVSKLAEYPVTRLIYDTEDEKVQKLYTALENLLHLRQFQVEVGLDYFAYGNCFVSIWYPLNKFLRCKGCGTRYRAEKNRSLYTWKNQRFFLKCPACKKEDYAEEVDTYPKSIRDISLIRWNPENIEVGHNEINGRAKYYYKLPRRVVNDIKLGDPDTVENLPIDFLEACRESKALLFRRGNFYHLKRPTIAQKDLGWGTPLIYPLLKDAFYFQVMKKSQECIATWSRMETEKGLVQASDVEVGDVVKTASGSWGRVSKKSLRPMVPGRDFAVEIAVTGLRQMSTTFSDPHPLWVMRRNNEARRVDTKERQRGSIIQKNSDLYDFQWVDAGEVLPGDYIGYPTERNREVTKVDVASYTDFVRTDNYVYSGASRETAEAFEFLERGEWVKHDNAGRVAKRVRSRGSTPKRCLRHLELTPELGYIAGWYLGDGSHGARRLDFSMGPDDDGVELQEAIEEIFDASVTSSPMQNARGWMLTASETIASEFFHRWIPGTACEKRIPRELMEAPDAVVLEMLRGYLEADGYIDPKKDRVCVCCSNGDLLYQIWQLLLSLGCISTISERESHESTVIGLNGHVSEIAGGRPVFYLNVIGGSARRLLQLMRGEEAEEVYSGKSGFFFRGYFASRIHSVEVVDCPEVISFEIEGEHTFCVPGMATHNSILMEHIVPLRVIYPGQNTGGNDAAFGAYNLSNWKAKIDAELNLWKRDHNYIPILPVNVGFQNWGGDAKILLMHQEMRMVAEQMLAGAGVPVEFVFGGLQWSGTNTSLRALENMFLGYNGQRHELINDFILGNIAAHMDWPRVHARFDRFRMADDLQRSMFYLQLNQAQKISDRRLAEELGEDFDQEITRMGEELKRQLSVNRKMQVASADIQGEAQLHQSRYQAKAIEFQTKAQLTAQTEAMQGMPGAPGMPGAQPPQIADQQAMAAQPMQPGVEGAPADATAPQEPAGMAAQVGGQSPQPDSSFVPNQSKVPISMASPIQMGAGGVDLRYVAQRAASYLKTVKDEKGADAMYHEMEQMQTENPQVYKLVIQLMQDTGSKVNPMDAQKAPAPAGTPQKDISRSIG